MVRRKHDFEEKGWFSLVCTLTAIRFFAALFWLWVNAAADDSWERTQQTPNFRQTSDGNQLYVGLQLMYGVSATYASWWYMGFIFTFSVSICTGKLAPLAVTFPDFVFMVLFGASIGLQKQSLIGPLHNSCANAESSELMKQVTSALLENCINGNKSAIPGCKEENTVVGNCHDFVYCYHYGIAGLVVSVLTNVSNLIVCAVALEDYGLMPSATSRLRKIVMPVWLIARFSRRLLLRSRVARGVRKGLRWIFSCCRRELRMSGAQPATTKRKKPGRSLRKFGSSKDSSGLKRLSRMGKDEAQAETTIVELQEVVTGTERKPSPFEYFLANDDLFLELCEFLHGNAVTELRAVSRLSNAIMNRHIENYAVALSQRLCPNAGRCMCWGCGTPVCSACRSGGITMAEADIVFQNRTLHACCSRCYVRAMWDSQQQAFASMWKWCGCKPTEEVRRLCTLCYGSARYISRRVPLGENLRQKNRARTLRVQAKARAADTCTVCKEKLWPFALKWWRCDLCKREKKDVLI